MKEVEKKDVPEVSGGYRNDGGCIPLPGNIVPLPEPLTGDPYPAAPASPWVVTDPFVTDPPAA